MYLLRVFPFLVLFAVVWPFSASGEIEWSTHPLKLSEEEQKHVQFGYLKVPENRSKPDSRDIKMAFTVIRSHADTPADDALLLLPGGPGQGFAIYTRAILTNPNVKKILEQRDVVLIDPRGNGYSHPKLCSNLNTRHFHYHSSFKVGQELDTFLKNAFKVCADQIQSSGADVSGYNSVELAHDVEMLRHALGYRQWNIRGASYGSYYGFVLMQSFPESIRSAYLSSIVSIDVSKEDPKLNFMASLNGAFETCESDPVCSSNYPDLPQKLRRVLQRLEQQPIKLTLFDASSDTEESFVIGPTVLVGGILTLLYEKQGIEILPAFLGFLEAGNDWIISNVAGSLLSTFEDIDKDMLWIIANNDLNPRLSPPPTNTDLALEAIFKPEWLPFEATRKSTLMMVDILQQTAPEPPLDFATVDIPTLLVSGELDPVTPPDNAFTMMPYLSNVAHHIVAGSGHFATSDAEFDFLGFYINPDPHFDFEAATTITPLDFVTGIYLNKGVSNLSTQLAKGDYSVTAIPAISLILCVFGLFYFPVHCLREGKSGVTVTLTMSFLWLLSLSSIALAVLLTFAIYSTYHENPYILAVGLARQWGFTSYLMIGLGVLLALNVLNYKSLLQTENRIPNLTIFIGGVGFVIFLVNWGFYF